MMASVAALINTLAISLYTVAITRGATAFSLAISFSGDAALPCSGRYPAILSESNIRSCLETLHSVMDALLA